MRKKMQKYGAAVGKRKNSAAAFLRCLYREIYLRNEVGEYR